ncbi:Cadherin domain containing protein, partial [Aphelenchoides avenae]
MPVSVSDGIHVTHATVHIKVIDDSKAANRLNSLQFQRSHYKISVRENITAAGTAGQSLLSLWTVGALAGETFRYRMLSPHDSFELDDVNGLLSVVESAPLDRERTPKLELAIEAVSTADSERRARCIVSIEVEDINDNAPVFHQTPYIISISEDASVGDRLLSVKAKDADVGMNGVIRYALSDDAPAYLAINKYDGRLTVAAPPPPLSIGTEFTFHIVATDQGNPPLSSRVAVHMRVVSKHQPVFSHGRYAAKVSEAAVLGTEVVTVRAHSKTNGMLGYRIVDGDPMRQFAVDFFSGVLTVNKALGREEVATYNLTVEATDVTRVNASSATYVVITIEDVNDSPPQFEKPIYYLSVSEDTSVGSRIGEVHAKDPDTVPTSNRVSYSLREAGDLVASIDRSSGLIVLAKPLDFESAGVHEYTLVASDADGLSGEAILVIEVTDVNDEPPTFAPSTPSSLRMVVDGEAMEQFVHKFDAVDNDT